MLEPLKFGDHTIARGKNFKGIVYDLGPIDKREISVEELISLDGIYRNLFKRTFSFENEAAASTNCIDPGIYLISNKAKLVIDDNLNEDYRNIMAYGDVVINKEIELDILFVKGNLKINADIKVDVLLVEGTTVAKKGTTIYLRKFSTANDFRADKIILSSEGYHSFVYGSFILKSLSKKPATSRDYRRHYIRIIDDFICEQLAIPCKLDMSGNVKISGTPEITDTIKENYITIAAEYYNVELGPEVHIDWVTCDNLKVGKDSCINFIRCKNGGSLEAEGILKAKDITVEGELTVINGYVEADSIHIDGNIQGNIRKRKKKHKYSFYNLYG